MHANLARLGARHEVLPQAPSPALVWAPHALPWSQDTGAPAKTGHKAAVAAATAPASPGEGSRARSACLLRRFFPVNAAAAEQQHWDCALPIAFAHVFMPSVRQEDCLYTMI